MLKAGVFIDASGDADLAAGQGLIVLWGERETADVSL